MILTFLQSADPNSQMTMVATAVIAVATVAYVVATILLWWTTKQNVDITRRLFEASQRPYVGVIAVQRTNEEERATFTVTYINAGDVFAQDVRASLTLIVDGIIIPNVIREQEHYFALLPKQHKLANLIVHEAHELKKVKEGSAISLIFKCSYKGFAEKPYSTEEKIAYDNLHGQFTTIYARLS